MNISPQIKEFPFLKFCNLILLNAIAGSSCGNLFALSRECQSWFSQTATRPGISCVYDCTISKTTVQNAHCPVLCPELCEQGFAGAAFFKLSNLYPGLTMAERALVSEFPMESVRAYAYSWKAEELCEEIYGASLTNDESDACRHFIWAGLMSTNLGLEFSLKFLDAHEATNLEPLNERSMDYANNRAGIIACERLSRSKKCDAMNLVREFKSDLAASRLIVIKPRRAK